MTEVPIKPKNEFSFISLPRRGLSEGAQILGNFEGVPEPNGDVLFYRLLRSPSDNPPEQRDLEDRLEVWGNNDYPAKVFEIAGRVLEMSRPTSTETFTETSTEASAELATARKEWLQYLNVIEFGGGIGQTLNCLEDDRFRFRRLVSPEALEPSGGSVMPAFGVFLKGNFQIGNDQDPEKSEKSVLVVRIPYLGPEGISPPESQEDSESWGLSRFISQTVTGLEGYPLEEEELPVHQAIFVVLNNAVIMVSKSKEDQGARMVFPQQDRVGVFHILVHMVSETLRSGERSILAALESRATLFEIQSLLPNGGSAVGAAGKILGRITAIKALVAEQTAILEDLKNIFGRAVPDFKHPSLYSNKYTKTMLRVPVLSGPTERPGGPAARTRGQMSYVAATLETIIEERQQFGSKGARVFETIQKAQATVATSGQAQELKNELSEKLQAQTLLVQEQQAQAQAQAEALQEEIEIQGKTLSAFTVVNVLFLPLGFFTSYFSAGDQNIRNGAIGTSLGLFWAVAAPCTFFIAAVATYFVLESQYELRQFGRLFVDMLKLKGWKWPITKADATFQKSYLRRLPKYRVLAIPADPKTESQFKEDYYLKKPEVEPGAGGNGLPLRVRATAYPDEFRFDEENGWLFYDEVDEYDYMYYAIAINPSVPPGVEKLSLSWERERMVMDMEPYRFRGTFRAGQGVSEKFLHWGFCNKTGGGREPRWDTGDILHASNFEIEQSDEDGRGGKLSVKVRGFDYRVLYRLKLSRVGAETP